MPEDSKDVVVYSQGLFYSSVCVPKNITPEDIVAGMFPAGTSRGWKVSEDPTFRQGKPNPCPCNQDPERLHYLMDC
jgi:hypothetical protein